MLKPVDPHQANKIATARCRVLPWVLWQVVRIGSRELFILAGLGLSLGLLPAEGMSLVLAGALISIALNPFVFAGIAPLQRWILARSALARRLEQREDSYAELPAATEDKYLRKQIVPVGYGRVGRRIARALEANSIPYVVAEQNRELVEDLRRQGVIAKAAMKRRFGSCRAHGLCSKHDFSPICKPLALSCRAGLRDRAGHWHLLC